MSGARIPYTARPDATPEGERETLASIYAFVLQSHPMDPTPHPSHVNEWGPVGGFLALQEPLHGPYGGTPRGRGQDEVRRSGLTDRNQKPLTQILRAVGSLDPEDHEAVTGYPSSPADVHRWQALAGEDIVERMLRA